MLKKYLSAFIALILIITTVISISLVTAYATGDVPATEDLATTMCPCEIDISREQLEDYASHYFWTEPGDILTNTDKVREAIKLANEVLANPNASQEDINNAYNNLLNANNSVKCIGYISSPFLSGDYDKDKTVSIIDVTEVQMLVARMSPFFYDTDTDYCYADVNFDFKINIKDVTMIQCYVAGYTDEVYCGHVGQKYSSEYYYNKQYSLD